MTTSTIVLAHGFNVRDGGKETLDQIKPYLERTHNILQADYGWVGLLGVRLFGDNIARLIAGMTPANAIGIGHSSGCMELVRACEMGAPFKRLVLINPALDNDVKFADSLQRIDVLHNQYDRSVMAAKYLPFHPWGDMGRVGYRGNDLRVINHETFRLFGVMGHSEVFKQASADLALYLDDVLGLRNYCGYCGN